MNSFGNSRVPDPPPGNRVSEYSAGKKRYGGGRSMPNIGPVDDLLGYAKRDRISKTKNLKSAVMRRMRAQDSGSYMKPDNLRWR